MADCAICSRPIADTAYSCTGCGDRARRACHDIADTAPAARDVADGQARRGPAVAGGSTEPRMPINPSARARYDAAVNTVTTWARHVAETRGLPIVPRAPAAGPPCTGATTLSRDCPHRSCADLRPETDPLAIAAAWLAGHIDWLRHRAEIVEAVDQLERAARNLVRIADRPPAQVLVGGCDCGQRLYAPTGAGTVRCRDCGARWDVDRSREILRRQLDGMLMTAAEIATMAVVGDPDAGRNRVRKLITVWSLRGRIEQHGHAPTGDPLYRFGEVMARLSAESQRSAA